MNPDNRLLVNLYSDANFLALNILENLLSKNCLVNIVTTDIKKWKERTVYIANKTHFTVLDEKEFSVNQKPNYIIFCGGFLIKNDGYPKLKKLLIDKNLNQTKTLALLPFEIFEQKDSSSISMNDNLGIVYLGDLLGPRLDLESDLLVCRVINEIIRERNLTLGVGEIFYPIFISDAVKTITKWLFSFGPYGKEMFLLGTQISGSTFWQENQKIVSGINLSYDNEIETRIVPRGYDIKTIPVNIRLSLLETYRWLSASKTKPVKVKTPAKPKKKVVYPKFLQPLIITLGLIALFPFLTLAISFGSFFISYKELVWGHENKSESLLLVGKTFSVLAKKESNLLSYMPILGAVYKETSFAGLVGEKISDMAIKSLPMVKVSEEFFSKTLGNEVYDPTSFAQTLKSGIGGLYRDLSLLEVETKSAANDKTILAKTFLEKFDFESFRNIASQLESLADSLPSILGKGESKTYLLLFENNMELRPTGGFIGSYGLITFDGGRMSDLTVSDIYSADGQLNGHVEPPTPIKDYLGEANWWFRDSNWDPDFPTSAKRAEWFLDKEVGRKVDGVVAIDLSPIKDILKYTGPLFLPDFNLSVDNTNLYEKTQSEVQDNFFPGTHKKASFLTALSRNLISEVGKTTSVKKINILRAFFNNLEGRHIQIYLHDQNSQNSLSTLRWDGSVITPKCNDNCYADFVGTVEANVGVNKANYFITRRMSLNVNITPTEIDRHLTLSLKNSANPALDLSGRYKTYVRFIIPAGSEVLSLKESAGQNSKDLIPEIVEIKDRLEVGALVEVLGGQSKDINISWRSNIPADQTVRSYGLYVRKQAGVTDDPFSLTVDGKSVYNTVLTKDILWTKKY